MFLIILMCSAGVPSAPRNISVDNITAHSANLRWDAPRTDGGSQILGYIIEKRQAFSQRFIRVNRELVHATSFTLSDLIEGNDYEVRVIAENAAGESKPSDTTGTFLAKDPYGMLNYCIQLWFRVLKISLHSTAGGYLCYFEFAHSSTETRGDIK